MIPTQIIITFLLTTLLFFWEHTIRVYQKSQDKRQKRPATKRLKLKNKQEVRTIIGLKEVFIERKPKPTPKKINIIFQVIRERSYELLEKNTHLSAMIKDLKLYINKFIHNKDLIYLEMRKFGRTKDYLAEYIVKKIRKENKEKVVEILRT